jgi:hypothetical protein
MAKLIRAKPTIVNLTTVKLFIIFKLFIIVKLHMAKLTIIKYGKKIN